MATFNIRRFAQLDTLKSINPFRLVTFLTPYAEFLSDRGLALSGDEPVDYEQLASVLMNMELDSAPQALLESLYLIHEMATPDGMDRLLDVANDQSLPLEQDSTSSPADIAIQVFLANRDLLERQHANTFINRVRSFLYFCGHEAWGGSFTLPSDNTLHQLEKEMDDWFESKRRGRGSRVFVFDHGKKVNLVVRHGMPFKREAAVEDGGKSGSVYYRPECHDVLVYDKALNELCIKAGTKGEREMYLLLIGRHLFGDDNHFPGKEKYSLQPLLDEGAESLACDDVEGIDWILLREIAIYRGGKHSEVEKHQAKDLFGAFEERNYTLWPTMRLVTAQFEVKFSDSSKSRMLVILPSNRAKYTRDDDSNLLEKWMTKRGFIISNQQEDEVDAELEPAVVGL
uniref:Uncharacterized protein n=1 Tax=Magnetococcus massalia (strain MO-1) TaxID=451514 RepID=A0A1S7LJ38_MAGMO|nr:conserved protein of unknown function [Candidatus Magnetococcus massalia]